MTQRMNKKGSSTIFLAMVLSSMILITMSYIQVAKRVAGESVGQSVALISGRSLLSEYDKGLKKDFGLFAFRGENGFLASKMEYYMEPFYAGNPYYRLNGCQVFLSKHRLSNPSVFEDAISEYMVYAASKDLVNLITGPPVNVAEDSPEIPSYPPGRILRNHKVIECLPSRFLGDSPGLLDTIKTGLQDWENAFRNTSKNYLVNQYIMVHFKNAQNDQSGRQTFFNYEAEYILKGDLDDDQNKRLFRRDLLLLRNVINMGTIYADPIMRQQLVAAASVLTPGPGAAVTQLLIAEAWALAEAENDVRLLEHGRRVPIKKTSETWAIDLPSILSGTEQGYIDTKATNGLDYQGYIQIFLFFEQKSVKLTRMMDLIQINIQGIYDRTFLITEHQVGLSYETQINYFTIHGETTY